MKAHMMKVAHAGHPPTISVMARTSRFTTTKPKVLGEQNESLRTAWSDGETPEAGSPPFVFGKAGRGIAFQGQTSYGEVRVQANQLLNEPQSEAN